MTKDEILKANVGLIPFLDKIAFTGFGSGLNMAMEEYAKQKAIEFDKWKWENRWFSFENGYWYQTHEQGTAMSEATYNKYHRKTREQLYDQFIESQNKQHGTED